jgi:multicomponent Na+:H+ antiporter subunit F
VANAIFTAATAIAILGFALAAIRFAKGPGAIDRVIALDALTIIATSLIVAFAFYSGRKIYIDVGMVYGLVGFAGVVALARYLEGGL